MPRRKAEEWYWQVGNDLQRIGDELTRARPIVATGRYWEPRADLMDLGDRLLIRVELAGVRGEDIALLYNQERNCVLIRGVRMEDGSEDNRLGFYQLEIPYGEFAKEVPLPDVPIVESAIRAQYRNGFLIVVVPKNEAVVVETTVTITNL